MPVWVEFPKLALLRRTYDLSGTLPGDQKRKVEERIDALLLEGLGSGEPVRVTNEYWDEKKRKLTERLGKAIGPQ